MEQQRNVDAQDELAEVRLRVEALRRGDKDARKPYWCIRNGQVGTAKLNREGREVDWRPASEPSIGSYSWFTTAIGHRRFTDTVVVHPAKGVEIDPLILKTEKSEEPYELLTPSRVRVTTTTKCTWRGKLIWAETQEYEDWAPTPEGEEAKRQQEEAKRRKEEENKSLIARRAHNENAEMKRCKALSPSELYDLLIPAHLNLKPAVLARGVNLVRRVEEAYLLYDGSLSEDQRRSHDAELTKRYGEMGVYHGMLWAHYKVLQDLKTSGILYDEACRRNEEERAARKAAWLAKSQA